MRPVVLRALTRFQNVDLDQRFLNLICCTLAVMPRDKDMPRKAAASADDVRTEVAKRVIEDYARALREMLQKLRRRLFH